jgi:hypothetical protein
MLKFSHTLMIISSNPCAQLQYLKFQYITVIVAGLAKYPLTTGVDPAGGGWISSFSCPL